MNLEQLIAAMMQGLTPTPSPQSGGKAPSQLAQTMARGPAGRARPGDAKYARLAALQPYGESKHADTFGHDPGAAQTGAFQDTGFQDDGYQVF